MSRIVEGALPLRLNAEAQTYDGWDRLSESTKIEECRFRPKEREQAPPLAGVLIHEVGEMLDAEVQRLVSSGDGHVLPVLELRSPADEEDVWKKETARARERRKFAEWTPDALTRQLVQIGSGVRLQFYQRLGFPSERVVEIVSTQKSLATRSVIALLKEPVFDLDFAGGKLAQGVGRFAIISLNGKSMQLSDPSGNIANAGASKDCEDLESGATWSERRSAIQLGSAIVRQDPFNKSLWMRVPESAGGIVKLTKQELATSYRIAGVGTKGNPVQQTLSFTWRLEATVEGVDITGAFAAAVTAIRPASPPAPPPNFEVAVVGYDYYGRVLVRIALPESVDYKPDGEYEVFWCEAASNSGESTTFESKAVPGHIGRHKAQGGRFLFEVFDIQRPVLIDGEYLIGVRAVAQVGLMRVGTEAKVVRSAGRFSTRHLTIPAE